MKPKFFLQTMGCQMNKNDSERIIGLLVSAGMEEVGEPKESDLLIINTCSVRQSAEDRVFGIVRNWQEIKRDKPKVIIAVTGCMPGRDREGKLGRKLTGADLFFGIEELPRLPQWVNELNPDLLILGNTVAPQDYLNIEPRHQYLQRKIFLTIQTGCNNCCSYCVVPYARGRERNRSVKEILQEARHFALKGGLEITLLGQVVNHFIAPDPENFSKENPYLNKDDFAALLWEINQIEGIKRVHFTAAHPQFFTDYQIEALTLPNQVNYLHLPVQSGDNEILKKMNRKYSREDYIKLIEKIRQVKPDIAIGTDLIVGFCGETDDQFKNTLDLYKECDFDISYTAMYSERAGTVAAKALKNDVSRDVKKHRWDELQALMESMTFRKNQKYVGQTVSVMVDSWDNGICSGLSSEMKLVHFLSKTDLTGKIIKAKIFEAKEWLLKGEMV